MSYGNIGETIITFILFLMALSGIGLISIIYCIGHFMGYWG